MPLQFPELLQVVADYLLDNLGPAKRVLDEEDQVALRVVVPGVDPDDLDLEPDLVLVLLFPFVLDSHRVPVHVRVFPTPTLFKALRPIVLLLELVVDSLRDKLMSLGQLLRIAEGEVDALVAADDVEPVLEGLVVGLQDRVAAPA